MWVSTLRRIQNGKGRPPLEEKKGDGCPHPQLFKKKRERNDGAKQAKRNGEPKARTSKSPPPHDIYIRVVL